MKAKQDKGRHCRINATVTEEERAALDRLAKIGGFRSVSELIGTLATAIDAVTVRPVVLESTTIIALALRIERLDVPGVKP